MPDPLATIRRKLEKAELEHLRLHIAELADRLERMERERDEALESCRRAWETSDAWHDQTMELTQELLSTGSVIGMTVDGEIGVVE